MKPITINTRLERKFFSYDLGRGKILKNCYWENFGEPSAELYQVTSVGEGEINAVYLSMIHRGFREGTTAKKSFEECLYDPRARLDDLIKLGKAIERHGGIPFFTE